MSSSSSSPLSSSSSSNSMDCDSQCSGNHSFSSEYSHMDFTDSNSDTISVDGDDHLPDMDFQPVSHVFTVQPLKWLCQVALGLPIEWFLSSLDPSSTYIFFLSTHITMTFNIGSLIYFSPSWPAVAAVLEHFPYNIHFRTKFFFLALSSQRRTSTSFQYIRILFNYPSFTSS